MPSAKQPKLYYAFLSKITPSIITLKYGAERTVDSWKQPSLMTWVSGLKAASATASAIY